MFFISMMTIAAFDIYEIGDDVNNILDLEPTEPVNNNFNRLGLESRYFINNVGTLMLWPLIILFLLIFYGTMKKCSNFKLCHSMRGVAINGLSSLKYSAIITMVRESFSLVMLCALINIPIISFGSYGVAM